MKADFIDLDNWESCIAIINAIRRRWPHISIIIHYDENHPEHTEKEKTNETDD